MHGGATPLAAPDPLTFTVKETGCRSKTAVTICWSPAGVNVHTEALLPAHGADHDVKRDPTAAVAVRLSGLPSKIVSWQSRPQANPTPVTVPTPTPSRWT